MGSKQSSAVRLPQISKQHWHEIPFPSTVRRKSSHGQYKLLKNVLTNQKIQEYNSIFQKSEEYEQYLQSFTWRARHEDIIQTKYFDKVREDSFCSSRIYAKIYLQHTPFRLSSLNDIPIPENLYVITSALAGFQKLYSLIGYFRANQDMIGIDTQARVKVWLNNNFSRNYIFGPDYVEDSIDILPPQQKMVMEIITLIERYTSYQQEKVPKLLSYVKEIKYYLTFDAAQKALIAYSKKYHLVIPKYVISLLKLLQDRNNLSQDEYEASSFTDHSFKVSQKDIHRKNDVIHYINPVIESNQTLNRFSHIEISQKGINSLTRHEQDFLQIPRSSDTTGETIINNNIRDSYTPSNKIRDNNYNRNARLPLINFKYTSKNELTAPEGLSERVPQRCEFTAPQLYLPLSRIVETISLESLGATKRMTYSDIYDDYELDEELAEDLVKYINN